MEDHNYYEEEAGLFELCENIKNIPFNEDTKEVLLVLLNEHGTDPQTNMWLRDTIEVIDRIVSVVGYLVADSKTFGYETTTDYEDVLKASMWVRCNLGRIIS